MVHSSLCAVLDTSVCPVAQVKGFYLHIRREQKNWSKLLLSDSDAVLAEEKDSKVGKKETKKHCLGLGYLAICQ